MTQGMKYLFAGCVFLVDWAFFDTKHDHVLLTLTSDTGWPWKVTGYIFSWNGRVWYQIIGFWPFWIRLWEWKYCKSILLAFFNQSFSYLSPDLCIWLINILTYHFTQVWDVKESGPCHVFCLTISLFLI